MRIWVSSPSSMSPILRLLGVALPSSASSPSVHSVTSHSTCTPPSVCPPRCCLKRPSRVLRTISSNQGAPRDCGPERATVVRVGFVREGPAAVDSSSLLSLLLGR